MHGEHDLECGLAGKVRVGLGAADAGLGDGGFLPGADGSGGRHHQAGRGRGHAPCLAEHRTTVIPLLRSERRDDLDGGYREPPLGLAGCVSSLAGDVRNPPLLPLVLWPRRGNSARRSTGKSRGRGDLRTASNRIRTFHPRRLAITWWSSNEDTTPKELGSLSQPRV